MESDSRNRRGRGRPRAFDEDLVEMVMQERGLGRRQAQNHLYAFEALHHVRFLRDEGNTFAAWILGDGEEKRVRWSVLAELGRLLSVHFDDDDIEDWQSPVEWVADHFLLGGKRRVKDVVMLLRSRRRWLYGEEKRISASTLQLYRELEQTVTEYRRRHHDLSREQAHEAARMLFDSIYLNYHDAWIRKY